jgi:hypothetical protein
MYNGEIMNIKDLVIKVQLSTLATVASDLKLDLQQEVLMRKMTLEFGDLAVKIIESKSLRVQSLYLKMLEAQAELVDLPEFKELTSQLTSALINALEKLHD